jgi:hypothetical protein
LRLIVFMFASTCTDQLEGERWESYVTTMMTSLRLPSILKKIIARVLPDQRAAALVRYTTSYAYSSRAASFVCMMNVCDVYMRYTIIVL